MNIDITQLLIIFDELMTTTDEERGIYWFKTLRSDGLVIIFVLSIHEAHVSIIINNTAKVDIASLSLENCSEVKVLDEKRKCLEILHQNGRCFLSLLGSPILKYEDQHVHSNKR